MSIRKILESILSLTIVYRMQTSDFVTTIERTRIIRATFAL
jgi:hypothetical protein